MPDYRYPDNNGLISDAINSAQDLEKSPLAIGFMAGLKAALLGAPIGAGIQLVRGGNPLLGTLIGAAVPGLIAGTAAASSQKLENLNTEAALRYHIQKIKEREPMYFMPPPQHLGHLFAQRFARVRREK